MRISLAAAVTLALAIFGVHANAQDRQDIARSCAAEARAKGLYGREQGHFEARCKSAAAAAAATAATWPPPPALAASNPKVIIPTGDPGRSHCASNSPLLGACPLCVIFLWFAEDDRHCYVY